MLMSFTFHVFAQKNIGHSFCYPEIVASFCNGKVYCSLCAVRFGDYLPPFHGKRGLECLEW